MLKALATALRNGRVTAVTAGERAIARAVALRYLTPDDLAGVYVLTAYGRAMAGDPPF